VGGGGLPVGRLWWRRDGVQGRLWRLDGEVVDDEEAPGLFVGGLRRFGEENIGGGARRCRRRLGAGQIPGRRATGRLG
jgi:hypothetical protein